MVTSVQPGNVAYSSASALKPMLVGMRIMGCNPPERYKALYYVYGIGINIIVSFYYPLSMFIHLFSWPSKKVVTSSISHLAVSTIVSLKALNGFINWNSIFELRQSLAKLDSRIQSQAEVAYMDYILKHAGRFFKAVAMLYSMGAATVDLPALLSKERILLFPAWFPFDWKNSTTAYWSVHLYQALGIYLQIFDGWLCDSYPAILFWLLKGHLRALNIRISKIGWYANSSARENYQQLVDSIEDYKECIVYLKLCQKINSKIMLAQFVCTQLSLCMTAVYILLYNDDFFKSTYMFVYFVCMIMEVSLGCFCGTHLTEESNNFTRALFSCNWMDQNMPFKKTLIIFMQNTQKPWEILAGGIFSISLQTWLVVLKSTYSLFAVFGGR